MLYVGKTPLVEVEGIYAKLECTNPLGSIKDRMALYIIEQSEKLGLLKSGMTIVEASSGNTGIALSYFARQKGYSTIIIMPENMTDERKRIIRSLGAELILCSAGNFAEATKIRDKIAEDPQFFNPNQFSNPLNVDCHYETTGQEILEQMKPYSKNIGAFVAGVGTGGTLIGCGKRLKEAFPKIQIVAVEPSESHVMSGGEPGIHEIAGIGDGFIPEIISDGMGGINKLIDEVVCCSTREAKDMTKYLADKKCLCVGMSSGANFFAAKQISKAYGTVVTVFPDGFSKYKSQGLIRNGSNHCKYQTCNCPRNQECSKANDDIKCKCN